MRLLLIGEVPVDGPDLVCFRVVVPDWIFGLVVAQQYLVVFEVDGLAADVVPEQLLDGGLDADVPEVDGAVPAAAQQDVRVVRVPLEAEDAVLVVAQVPSFQLGRFSFVEVAHQDLSEFSREGVVASSWADLAGLQHLLVLDRISLTFFWKRSWREVACQYSRVPSECVAMKACRRLSLLGLKASPVTGEWSVPLSTYCTFSVSTIPYSGWRRRS